MKTGHPADIIREAQSGKITTLNCEGCHRCCDAGVTLTNKEARTHPLKFYVHQYANCRPELTARKDGYCALLSAEGRCTAYAVRPAACKEYDCRVVALRNMALAQMGVAEADVKTLGAVRPDWEFEITTDDDRAVLAAFARIYTEGKLDYKNGNDYPTTAVRRPDWKEAYAKELYGDNAAGRLGEIAKTVGDLARDIEITARKTAEGMEEAGRLLLEAKELVKHGEFRQWITHYLRGVPYRTAASWMSVAKGKRRETLVARLQETPLQLLSEKQEARFLGAGPNVQPALLPLNEPKPLQVSTPASAAALPLGLPRPRVAADLANLIGLIKTKLEEGVTLTQIEEALSNLCAVRTEEVV